MPAKVELFNQTTKPASKVYWDSSFIIDIKLYINNTTKPRLKSCKDFFDLLQQNNVMNVTSVLAIEEVFYIGLFEWGIKQDMKSYSDVQGNPYSSIKKFKRDKPKEFQQSYQNHISKVYDIWNFINNIGLKIIYPRPFITNPNYSISHRVTNYARLLLNKYMLETKDAFHISISRCAKIRHIVTCDSGFKQVDGIYVYCPR